MSTLAKSSGRTDVPSGSVAVISASLPLTFKSNVEKALAAVVSDFSGRFSINEDSQELLPYWMSVLGYDSEFAQSPAVDRLAATFFKSEMDGSDIANVYAAALEKVTAILLAGSRWKPGQAAAMINASQTAFLQSQEVLTHALCQQRFAEIQNSASNKFADEMLDQNVDLSMSINEVAVINSTLMKEMADIDGQAQSIAAAVEEMATGITTISENSREIAEKSQSARNTAQGGADTISNTAENMRRVAHAVNDATKRVESLAETSEKIGAMVETIENIASQTNLLALNATIEAARAGEAGKGFAVVAGEVKNLSSQTAKATVDIRDNIVMLREEIGGIVEAMRTGAEAVEAGDASMNEAVGSMNDIGDMVSDVTDRMGDIAAILEQQEQVAAEVSDRVANIAADTADNVKRIETSISATDSVVTKVGQQIGALAEFDIPKKAIRIAKSDHVIWKKRLADMLAGRQALYADELASHMSCRLGKWYYSPEGKALAGSAAYKEIEGPHKIVHECGIEAVKRYNDGDVEGALELYGKVESASREVVRLLDALVKS
ncbi:methyl-accepting chemotaxis protein [Thalassospira sp.]|uniref:methyl-accepting chemotaxis protein n=1 Tax=Thalassospira sp. TaxID=1912094 RepID=UPI000C62E11A|nr:methyl-accepting chemotaxis protein [Thalassospira sp.]MBC07314.1 hypothetical protein [Thalassospira sp.]